MTSPNYAKRLYKLALIEHQDSQQLYSDLIPIFAKLESEKVALESQIESIIRWVKKERSGSGTAQHSTLSVAEVEKKLLKLKQEYNRLIRDYNKKMLSKNQGGRLFKRIKFGDEAR